MTLTTLFDANYLVQGTNLLRSIFRHEGARARVVVLAMDKDTADYVRALNHPGIIVWEPDKLPDAYYALCKGVSRGEQCWMATPFLCRAVLRAYGSCEYLDADCYLFSPLAGVRREIGNAPVAIVPHRWDCEHADRLRINGTYNVGYVYWIESPQAYASLDAWVMETLDWRPEHGRYNDQLYIEDWPRRFNAHIVRHKGVSLAPYSQMQYDIRMTENGITVDGMPLIMYHFHEWRLNDNGSLHASGYELQWEVKEYIYKPYAKDAGAALGVIC